MFSFDGDFRRKKEQNLGGASQKHDRSELIRKAQHERQKRETTRRKNNGAIVIQSYIRSFITRQRIKKEQRTIFDDYLKRNNIKNDGDLGYLLKRILFFYQIRNNEKDGERLIFLCQFMLSKPQLIITNVLNHTVWQYRINRVLGLCLDQLFVNELSPVSLLNHSN